MKQKQNKMKESYQINNLEWNLSNESCRQCGGDLIKYSLCAVCKQTMQHVCVQCGSRSESMLHQCHVHLDAYQTRNSMIENTHSIVVWQDLGGVFILDHDIIFLIALAKKAKYFSRGQENPQSY